MASRVTELRVFVASPGDLREERTAVVHVIAQFNKTWSTEHGIRLEPVMWETHSVPGIGAYPQAVINTTAPQDYDIFVGMLWQRFGSPTPVAGSGTEEEFNIAYERSKSSNGNVQVLVYFKDAPVPISDIDPQQIQLLNQFKSSLTSKGVLWAKFTQTEEFSQLLTLHLSRLVQSYGSGWGTAQAMMDNSTPPLSTASELIARDDVPSFGLLDLMEIAEEQLEIANATLTKMSASIEYLGTRVSYHAKRIGTLLANSTTNNTKSLKRAVNDAALDLDASASNLEVLLPMASSAFRASMRAFIQAASVSNAHSSESSGDVDRAISQFRLMRDSITSSKHNIMELRDTVHVTPGLTDKLIKSKSRLASILDDVVNEWDVFYNLTSEYITAIERHREF